MYALDVELDPESVPGTSIFMSLYPQMLSEKGDPSWTFTGVSKGSTPLPGPARFSPGPACLIIPGPVYDPRETQYPRCM